MRHLAIALDAGICRHHLIKCMVCGKLFVTNKEYKKREICVCKKQKCDTSPENFAAEQKQNAHPMSPSPKNNFQSEECLSIPKYKQTHQNDDEESVTEGHKCLQCEKTFATLDDMMTHWAQETNEFSNIVIEFGKEESFNENEDRDEKPTDDKKMNRKQDYKCAHCDGVYNTKTKLREHFRKDNNCGGKQELNETFSERWKCVWCKLCKKKFQTQDEGRDHLFEAHSHLTRIHCYLLTFEPLS